MKKIGILFGMEDTFPHAFVDRVNSKKEPGIIAEAVKIDKVVQALPVGYDVIIDRISQDIPFYRAMLKNAALCGTAVINNPFWWTADDKFFNNCLAEKLGVAVPKTVIIPSYQHPPDTTDKSMRNLGFPWDWNYIFDYIGFPAYMKPYAGGGWKSVYRVESPQDFFRAHAETNTLVMMLQEEIVFDQYFRCYCLGQEEVGTRIMRYDPKSPHHLRYVRNGEPIEPKLYKKLLDAVLTINKMLGYDFNTVELAMRDGVPYAIDFCNPAPDADYHSVGPDNFEWVVEAAANLAIKKAKAHKAGANNLSWGDFVQCYAANKPLVSSYKVSEAQKAVPSAKPAAPKKAAAKPKATKAKA